MMKNCYLGVLLFAVGFNVYATESNPFVKFDNNVSAGLALGSNGIFNNLAPMLSGTLLQKNFWLNVEVMGTINYQATATDPSRISSGMDISAKLGYSIIIGDVNLIPYIGISYANTTNELHYDSSPIFTYNQSDMSFSIGLKPELALGNKVKLSLDSSITSSSQSEILPNSLTTLNHSQYQSYYLTITPAIQITPISHLNLEVFYQVNSVLNSNGGTSTDVLNNGYSSYQQILSSSAKCTN